jgi:nicotinamidase-related amidase
MTKRSKRALKVHIHCSLLFTSGAELHPELSVPEGAVVLRKGTNPELDSYSAFFDNTGSGSGDTGLAALLKGVVTEVSRYYRVGWVDIRSV